MNEIYKIIVETQTKLEKRNTKFLTFVSYPMRRNTLVSFSLNKYIELLFCNIFHAVILVKIIKKACLVR